MNKLLYLIAFTLLVASCGGDKKKKDGAATELKTDREKASYAIGLNEGERIMAQMKQNAIDTALDLKLFVEGVQDYFEQKARMNNEESRQVIMTYIEKLRDRQVEDFKARHAGDREKGEQFLEANKKSKSGLIITDSGLQLEVIKAGSGPKIALGDSISVNYTGTTIDGKTFDSSEGRGPFAFRLNVGTVIQGWMEGLQMMQKGGSYKLYIPYDLAYGDMGNPPAIGPYAVLIFDMSIENHVPAK